MSEMSGRGGHLAADGASCPEVGQVVVVDADRWHLTGRLGAGANGEVWAAREESSGRGVVLKFVSSRTPMVEELLASERASRRLEHPRLGRMLFETREGAWHVLGLRRAPGVTLARFLERRWSQGQTLQRVELERLLDGLLDPLAAMHRLGFVHRDIKPDNIVIPHEDGLARPWLVDFSSCWHGEMQTDWAQAGVSDYVAPEQRRAPALAGPQADVHALGRVLLKAAGRGRGANRRGPARLGRLGIDLEKAVAPQPADRWADATAWRRARTVRRHGTRMGGMLLLLLLLGGGGWGARRRPGAAGSAAPSLAPPGSGVEQQPSSPLTPGATPGLTPEPTREPRAVSAEPEPSSRTSGRGRPGSEPRVFRLEQGAPGALVRCIEEGLRAAGWRTGSGEDVQSGRITIEVAPAGPAGWEARARLVLGARIAELRWVSFDSPENARGFRQVDEGREAACAQIRAEVERAFR